MPGRRDPPSRRPQAENGQPLDTGRGSAQSYSETYAGKETQFSLSENQWLLGLTVYRANSRIELGLDAFTPGLSLNNVGRFPRSRRKLSIAFSCIV